MRNRLAAEGRRGLEWGIALAAVLALLQPALATFDIELSGWRVDHGHLFVAATGGALPEHDHPYDHSHDDHDHDAAAGANDEVAADVIFLSGDDVTSTAMPAAPIVTDAPRLSPPIARAVARVSAPSDVASAPPAPPPRA